MTKEKRPEDPMEKLGESINKISDAIIELKKTGINQKCIVDLMYLQTKLPRKTINIVFNSLEELKKVYCDAD